MKVPGIELIMECPGKEYAHKVADEKCIDDIVRIQRLRNKYELSSLAFDKL